MSHFPDIARRWVSPRVSGGFRLQFLLGMMFVVAAITATAVVVAQRHAESVDQANLEKSFAAQTTSLLAVRNVRLLAITDKCRVLSRSVRIRAALAEEDLDDLYRNAFDELREVFDDAGPDGPAPTSPGRPRALPHANFFGFVNAAGALMPPPGDAANGSFARVGLESFARQLATLPPGRRQVDSQEIGYLLVREDSGAGAVLDEVVVTPVVDPVRNERLGALVLGFPAETSMGADASSSPVGIWLGRRLHGIDLPEAAASSALPRLLGEHIGSEPAAGHFPVDLAGGRRLLFYQAMDVGASFPRAYGVCVYPLAGSLLEQAAMRWRIIGWGALTLLVGFALSFLVSGRLSAPVEKMARGATENLAGRRRAEAELIEANALLQKALVELKATQGQVIQQERLRALGEMASGIAHDFNNALMPILGFSELLIGMPQLLDDRDRTINYLQTINRGAKDAGSVVRRLREFYRPKEAGEEFFPVDLSSLVHQIMDLTQPKWKDQALARGATVEVRKQVEKLPTILGSESDLREALTNLVFNAVDAMPAGGTLTLTARAGEDCGIVEITDTGTGMDEETRRRCLEPFFSTKGERGTGLGLSMVFGIAQRHRGTVEIDSQLGVGSTFRLKLPAYRSDAKAARAAEEARPDDASLLVLAVDDEPPVREILVHMLEADGHRVVVASDAREALEQFNRQMFDLVITDMAMPGMSGDQLAAAFKALAPQVPVILLTGFGSFMDAEERSSAVDILASKPITLAGLRHALSAALKSGREAAVAG